MFPLFEEYENYDGTSIGIVVGWKSVGTYTLHQYLSAVKNMKRTSMTIAKYLNVLIENEETFDLNSIHIFQLFMGAHVSGALRLKSLRAAQKSGE